MTYTPEVPRREATENPLQRGGPGTPIISRSPLTAKATSTTTTTTTTAKVSPGIRRPEETVEQTDNRTQTAGNADKGDILGGLKLLGKRAGDWIKEQITEFHADLVYSFDAMSTALLPPPSPPLRHVPPSEGAAAPTTAIPPAPPREVGPAPETPLKELSSRSSPLLSSRQPEEPSPTMGLGLKLSPSDSDESWCRIDSDPEDEVGPEASLATVPTSEQEESSSS